MLFQSPFFLFVFLPMALAAYAFCSFSQRNTLLAVISLLFYAWGGMFGLGYLCLSILANFFFGRCIDRWRTKKMLSIAVGINLLGLAAFKYQLDFLMHVFAHIPWIHFSVFVPLGVSFFTFHAISYIVDIYRRTQPPQRSLIRLVLYFSFFPQLIAGPITRYGIFASQLLPQRRILAVEDLESGCKRFTLGLAKKVLLADRLAPFADLAFITPVASLSASVAWVGLLAYGLQLYFDFSGYTDMAIGLARMFGFHLPENFRWPYLATSITDFWRRWHLSLMEWFREYVYFPLGGSRGSLLITCRNLLIVFFLSGLWHGIGWHFIVWGVYFGVLLCMERLWTSYFSWRPPVPIRWLSTMALVFLGWVFFRSLNMIHALGYIAALSGAGSGPTMNALFDTSFALKVLCAGAVCATPLGSMIAVRLQPLQIRKIPIGLYAADALYGCLLLLACSGVALSTYKPFLYFTF